MSTMKLYAEIFLLFGILPHVWCFQQHFMHKHDAYGGLFAIKNNHLKESLSSEACIERRPCTSRRDILSETSKSLIAASVWGLFGVSDALAEDPLFRKNPLTNKLLEQVSTSSLLNKICFWTTRPTPACFARLSFPSRLGLVNKIMPTTFSTMASWVQPNSRRLLLSF